MGGERREDVNSDNLRKMEKKLISNLKDPGWTIMGVGASEKEPSFSYTVGLWYNFQHPEIIVFGLPIQYTHSILNLLGFRIKNDQHQFCENQEYHDIADGYPTRFRRVKPDNHFGAALSLYQQERFEALQLCWPDKSCKFPWEQEFDPSMKKAQPLLP
jgi:Domain of unknown function (DUF4262)